MPRWMTSILVFCFFVWILPLGIFISHSDEKTACDGQRAICLCSAHLAKAKVSGKVMLSSNQGTHKEAGSSGGGAHYFLSVVHNNSFKDRFAGYVKSDLFCYSFLCDKSIDHVPKA